MVQQVLHALRDTIRADNLTLPERNLFRCHVGRWLYSLLLLT
jgi:hypothetical protein